MKNHLKNDVWHYRSTVLALDLTQVASAGGAIALVGRSALEVLVALESAVTGGLAGSLFPTQLNR